MVSAQEHLSQAKVRSAMVTLVCLFCQYVSFASSWVSFASIVKSPHIVGLFCPYSRSLLLLSRSLLPLQYVSFAPQWVSFASRQTYRGKRDLIQVSLNLSHKSRSLLPTLKRPILGLICLQTYRGKRDLIQVSLNISHRPKVRSTMVKKKNFL